MSNVNIVKLKFNKKISIFFLIKIVNIFFPVVVVFPIQSIRLLDGRCRRRRRVMYYQPKA